MGIERECFLCDPTIRMNCEHMVRAFESHVCHTMDKPTVEIIEEQPIQSVEEIRKQQHEGCA